MTEHFDPDEVAQANGEQPPPDAPPPIDQRDGDAKRSRKSQATELVELAADLELFHTPDLMPYASMPVGDHLETSFLRGLSLKRWLSAHYYQVHGKAPAQSSVNDALGVLEGRALHEGPQIPVFVRIAERDEAIFIDLGDGGWRCIEVTANGWKVVARPPVRFRRPRGMAPLPDPIDGDVGELRRFVNVRDDDQFALLVAFIVAALRGRGPYPVLNLTAEQGSGKSTTQRVIRALGDPSTTPVRAEPRDARDVMIAASNSWIASFDNVSHLPVWLSDAICRLSTGGGFGTRELYSDGEEVLFDAMRPVMLNGIEELAVRGDLLDRSIILNLPGISEVHRRTETEFWTEFDAARPRILGGLLTAASVAIANLPTTRLQRLPRLADMATWVVAAEPALPWAPGTFLAAYSGNRADANDLALEASPIVPALRQLAAFTGTATELLALLATKADDETRRQRGWPKSAHGLSNVLRRLAPNLRASGIDVVFPDRDRSRRIISISRRGPDSGPTDESGKSASPASQASQTADPVLRAAPGRDARDAPRDARDAPRDAPETPDPCSGDAGDARDALLPTFSCWTCGRTEFWSRPEGARLCASCHPSPFAVHGAP